MNEQPYLSIVVCGRNDNYGGDFIQRLQNSLHWNIRLLEKYRVKTEIVIVNWNPVSDNPTLQSSLSFADSRKYVSIKIIDIPSEIHAQYIDEQVRKTVPIFEFIAKNYGIRRASGSYILSTNADILLSKSIVKFISENKPDQHHFYRANRVDFTGNILDWSEKDIFSKAIMISLKAYKYRLNNSLNKKYQYRLLLLWNMLKVKWQLMKFRLHKTFPKAGLHVVFENAEFYTHCTNSGDFLLLHKKNWLELKGYPEHTFIATHTDALFNVMCYVRWKEVVFGTPVFHQEHDRRFTHAAIEHDTEMKNIYRIFQNDAQKILAGQPVSLMNDDEWGTRFQLEHLIREHVF